MSNLPLLQPEEVLCCPPLAERALSPAEAERTAAMFKALGDPVRLRLFSLIVSRPAGEACVCEISDVGVSQPTVSHHLRKLKEAGLLTSQRRGTWVYYRAAPEVVRAMARMLMGALVGARRPLGAVVCTLYNGQATALLATAGAGASAERPDA